MGMLPGIGKMQKQIAAAGIDDNMIKRQEAIILSMTKKERASVGLLNASRRKRIAAGSGTSVQDVNRLVKQYQDMARMMKKLGGKTGAAAMKALLGGGMGGMGAPNVGGPNAGGMNAGAMPDLNALARGLGAPGQGLGGRLAKKLGGGLANGLPGLGGKPSGKKK
jgi:signal recognition particle subunit SRP54